MNCQKLVQTWNGLCVCMTKKLVVITVLSRSQFANFKMGNELFRLWTRLVWPFFGWRYMVEQVRRQISNRLSIRFSFSSPTETFDICFVAYNMHFVNFFKTRIVMLCCKWEEHQMTSKRNRALLNFEIILQSSFKIKIKLICV